MASGQQFPLRPVPTGTLFATEDTRTGGSTPAETIPVWDFDAATAEYMDFVGKLRGYGAGGLTFEFTWSATTATSNDVVWQVAIRRLADDAEDVDSSHTYVFNTTAAASTAPSVSGEVSEDTITFTDGADMDSLANGETFILRVRRLATDAGDTMAGDAELWQNMILRET